jgi:DNA-binding transcriptional LysR family regulator
MILMYSPVYMDDPRGLHNLDLDALRSFVLGVESGSFAKAANRIGRSTSAVSAQLKKLEGQVALPLLRKSGRNLVLTPTGEVLLSYAKRLLELNDEATTALRGANLGGCVKVGLQEDFGESLLTGALGSFARAHPRVQIEATVARNAELIGLVSNGRVDLGLAWDGGTKTAYSRIVKKLPMRWIGCAEYVPNSANEPLPLALLEAPCLMRTAAIEALDRAGIPWRVAFTSSSLSGIWAAVSSGLGVTVRTGAGLPEQLRVLNGLPELPQINLILHCADRHPIPIVRRLESILLEQLGTLVAQS